eukprot:Opistho-1_new@84372
MAWGLPLAHGRMLAMARRGGLRGCGLDGLGIATGSRENVVRDEILGVCLFPSVDDILLVHEAIGRGLSNHRVVAGGRVRNLLRRREDARLAQRNTAHEHLPLAHVAALVAVALAARATTNPVDILVALRRFFRKINAGTKHAANVRVALVEALLHNGGDKRRPVEEESLVGLPAVVLAHVLPAVPVALKQLLVLHALDAVDAVRREDAAGIASVVPYGHVHHLFDVDAIGVRRVQVVEVQRHKRRRPHPAWRIHARRPTACLCGGRETQFGVLDELVAVSVRSDADILQVVVAHVAEHFQRNALALKQFGVRLELERSEPLEHRKIGAPAHCHDAVRGRVRGQLLS